MIWPSSWVGEGIAHGLRCYTLSVLVCVRLRESGAGAGGNRTRRMLAMLVSEMSRGGATGMRRNGTIRMDPNLGMFYCKQMSATQCLTMDGSPDRPVISDSETACSAGSCACCRGVGARIPHPMELEGEA